MHLRNTLSATNEWLGLLKDLKMFGSVVFPRGKKTREVLAYQSKVDMCYPRVAIAERALGCKFLPGEAWWILSGQNTVRTIAPYTKAIAAFSDDGIFFHGAYGPKIVDQLTYVVDCLIEDPDSRQAVINIWRENPRKTKDVPCTISVQFLIRNGAIHCIDTMRSSDAWLGWPYDVFNFSMLSGYVALMIADRTVMAKGGQVRLNLGTFYLNAGSQHFYETNRDQIDEILASNSSFDYAPFDLDEYQDAEHLVRHLKQVADGDSGGGGVLAPKPLFLGDLLHANTK